MNNNLEDFYYNQGKTHWWIRGRHNLAVNLFKLVATEWLKNREISILDIGCGPGNFLDLLKEFSHDVAGNDISESFLDAIQKRGLSYFLGDVSRGELQPGRTFSLITMFDSLEHMDDDVRALTEAYKLLEPGGYILINVPPYNFLWSSHDDQNGHKRRYTKGDLTHKVSLAGFQIEKATYTAPFLILPLCLLRLVKNVTKNKSIDLAPLPNFLNQILLTIISREDRVLRYLNFPTGANLIVIAKKT